MILSSLLLMTPLCTNEQHESGLPSVDLGGGLVQVCLFLVMVAGFLSDLVITMADVVINEEKSHPIKYITFKNVLIRN